MIGFRGFCGHFSSPQNNSQFHTANKTSFNSNFKKPNLFQDNFIQSVSGYRYLFGKLSYCIKFPGKITTSRLRKAQQSSPPLSIYTPLQSPSEIKTTFKLGCRSLCYMQVFLAASCMQMLWLFSFNIFNYHMTYYSDT